MFFFFNSTIGEYNLNGVEGYEQNMTIDKIIKHPKYDALHNHDYDVAMVKLKNPIQYNSHVRPVCLAKAEFDIGTNCFISGWGYTEEGGEIPQVGMNDGETMSSFWVLENGAVKLKATSRRNFRTRVGFGIHLFLITVSSC